MHRPRWHSRRYPRPLSRGPMPTSILPSSSPPPHSRSQSLSQSESQSQTQSQPQSLTLHPTADSIYVHAWHSDIGGTTSRPMTISRYLPPLHHSCIISYSDGSITFKKFHSISSDQNDSTRSSTTLGGPREISDLKDWKFCCLSLIPVTMPQQIRSII